MKKSFFIIGVFIFITISVGTILNSFESMPNKTFVSIYAKFSENDMFQVFYRLKGDKFQEKHSVRKNVLGKNHFQEIVFELPEVNRIDRLRIDIGNNPQQTKIECSNFSIYTKSKTIKFSTNMWEVFKTNSFIEKSGETLFTHSKSNRYDLYLITDNISELTNSLNKSYKVISYPFLYASLLALLISMFLVVNQIQFSIREVSFTLFIITFFAILLSPTLDNIFVISPYHDNKEKRELSKLPKFTLSKEFSKGFEDYYNDHFGFRSLLINVGGKYKAKIFNASNNPDEAMVGKNGWIFYNTEVIFKSYSHSNLLTFEELNLFKNTFEERKSYLESSNIKYLFGFWPNKHSIYPENLPFPMKIQVKDSEGLADQLINFLRDNNSKFNIIDVRSILLENKSKNQIYRKLDTHWNSLGAYYAYNEFLKQSYNVINVNPVQIDEFLIEWDLSNEGDLINMLGIYQNDILSEKLPTLNYKTESKSFKKVSASGYPDRTVITKNAKARDKRKVLFFGDSYSVYLIDFFSLNFKDVVYLRSRYDEKLIEKVNPDIIIDAFVERQMIDGF